MKNDDSSLGPLSLRACGNPKWTYLVDSSDPCCLQMAVGARAEGGNKASDSALWNSRVLTSTGYVEEEELGGKGLRVAGEGEALGKPGCENQGESVRH